MKNHFCIIIIILTLTSCKKSDKEPIVKEINTETKTIESFDEKTQFLKKDELVASWEKELYEFPKRDLDYITEIKLIKLNNRKVDDTLKTWNYKNSYFTFHKKNGPFLLSSGLIKDPIFSINPKIKTGISKAEFGKILDTKIERDIVDISDTKNNAMFFFEFKNDTLDNISFEWRTE